jgi:hypothetical protein
MVETESQSSHQIAFINWYGDRKQTTQLQQCRCERGTIEGSERASVTQALVLTIFVVKRVALSKRLIGQSAALSMCLLANSVFGVDFRFDSMISREVPESYLSRSITSGSIALNNRC